MLNPRLIRIIGVYIPLTSQEEIERANKLVRKNPATYCVDRFYPSEEPSPTPLLHYIYYRQKTPNVLSWIQSGTGEEPD